VPKRKKKLAKKSPDKDENGIPAEMGFLGEEGKRNFSEKRAHPDSTAAAAA
jgi:hypothetical protein